jgi:hypothetical protein
MLFKNDLIESCKVDLNLTTKEIRNLPQLLRCDKNFILHLQNDTINTILNYIPKHPEYLYSVIDTKVHMLMKGDYPCIPGWHADDFYRPSISGSVYEDEYLKPSNKIYQPDLENVLRKAPSIHYMILLGDCSNTEFLDCDVELKLPKDNVYKSLNEEIENNKTLITKFLQPSTIYKFGPTTLHRGSPAFKSGWRFFLRLTYSNTRKPINEFRQSSQIYIKEIGGW